MLLCFKKNKYIHFYIHLIFFPRCIYKAFEKFTNQGYWLTPFCIFEKSDSHRKGPISFPKVVWPISDRAGSQTGCCGLNCFPPRPYVEALNLLWLYWQIGPFRKLLRQNEVIKVETYSNKIGIFIRRRDTRSRTHRGKTLWGHREKVAICNSRREASPETNPVDPFVLSLQPPELWEYKFLFKPPSLWYSVMAAWAD